MAEAAALFAGVGETEVRGTAGALACSRRRGEEVGGVLIAGGGAGGRRFLAGVARGGGELQAYFESST